MGPLRVFGRPGIGEECEFRRSSAVASQLRATTDHLLEPCCLEPIFEGLGGAETDGL